MSILSVPPFTSPRIPARWIQALLSIGIVLALAAGISGLKPVVIAHEADPSLAIEADSLTSADLQMMFEFLQFLFVIPTVVVFLVWIHRTHRNLAGLGTGHLRFSDKRAVTGFLVPFINVMLGPRIMSEIWYGSDPLRAEQDLPPEGPDRQVTPSLIGWWWGLLLISAFFTGAANTFVNLSSPTWEQIKAASRLFSISDVWEIPAAVVGMVIVARITTWQARRFAPVAPREGGRQQEA
jgi:hypothetical protein